MGLFSNIKAGIEAAQAAGNAMAGVEPASDIPTFINPRPQDEVDRLLAGTGTIRAIVLGKRHQTLEGNERVGAMRVHVRLRPRGPGGTLGDEVTVKATMSSWNAALVVLGLDIPVERDAAGVITKVASKQLADELAPRAAEANARNSGVTLDPGIEGMIDIAKAIVSPAAPAPAAVPVTDARLAPVEGITWQTYVAVCADIAVNEIASSGEDAVAQKYGVRAYTWNAIRSVWKNRIAADPELTAMFQRDVAAAS